MTSALDINKNPRESSICSCPECGKQYKSFQGLQLHRFKTHGVKNIYRRYVVESPHCTVCMKYFWTRERAVNHIRYRSKVCRNMLMLQQPFLSEEAANELDDAAKLKCNDLGKKGLRRHHAVEPCFRLSGPLIPIIQLNPSGHHPLGRGHNHSR